MSNFKFVQKLDDEIQSEVNMEVDNKVSVIRDQIDQIATEEAYASVANIMERMNLEGIPADPDEIHDELFSEVFDSIYNELGIY